MRAGVRRNPDGERSEERPDASIDAAGVGNGFENGSGKGGGGGDGGPVRGDMGEARSEHSQPPQQQEQRREEEEEEAEPSMRFASYDGKPRTVELLREVVYLTDMDLTR